MDRLYGDDQREVAKLMREDLAHKLDKIYLEAFEKLNSAGFGDGEIAKLTQLFLLSRDGAITPLKSFKD